MTINDVLRGLKPLPISALAKGVSEGDIISLDKAVYLCGYKTPASIRKRLTEGTIKAHCKCGRIIYFSRDQVEFMKETRGKWMRSEPALS